MYGRKQIVDSIVKYFLLTITVICASVIVFIVIFIFLRGIAPFMTTYKIAGNNYDVSIIKFMIGSTWFKYPNIYGVGFIIINTIYVVLFSLVIAIPISVLTGLFISRIAPKKLSKAIMYIIEILAAIPSIIYGLFGMGLVTQFVKKLSNAFGYQSAGGLSTLSTIIVLAIMIIPTVTMISTTAINSVRKELVDGSLALGATPTQTNFKMILRSAKSGIFSAIILGTGRALGEATAVSMVAGNSGSGPTFNLFATTRTLTSTMLLGLSETTGLDYDIRFSVGIVLIILILVTNLLLNFVKRRMEKC